MSRRPDSQILIDLEKKQAAVARRMAREADPRIKRMEKIQRAINEVLEDQKMPFFAGEQEVLLSADAHLEDAVVRLVAEFVTRSKSA